VLFTPKKYGRNFTEFLGIGFYASAVLFALSAVYSLFGQFDNWVDRMFAIVAFTAGTIIFGALGRDKWREASKMPRGNQHKR
jgi:hypothetical protein